MSGPTAYLRLKQKHSKFLVFHIAHARSDLQTKLENLQDHKQHIRLAQEFAAAHHHKA